MDLDMPLWIDIWGALAAVLLLVRPLLSLTHEVGHALAAAHFLSGPIRVTVGDWPHRPFQARIGRITFDVHAEVTPAMCSIDPERMLPREGFVIALAGPAASLVAAVGFGVLALAVGSTADAWGMIPAFSAVLAAFTAVRNTIPSYRAPTDSHPAGSATDGYLARMAWRAGLGSSEPLVPPAPPTSPGNGMTYHARTALETAGTRARLDHSGYVGTEHVMLGLLSQPDTAAARVLAEAGVASRDVERHLPTAKADPRIPQLMLTPAVVRSLDRAKNALTLRGDQCIDTEHILLGLIDEPDARMNQIIRRLGIDPTAVRAKLLGALS